MANENSNPIDVNYLMQQLGMTRALAEHTVNALNGDDDTVRNEDWLRQVSRDELMNAGVEPFAADRIDYFQRLLQNNNSSNVNNGNNGLLNGGILLGGAALGATQATAVGTAGLAAMGFGSSGVVAGSIAAGIQGPATAAGSWFALCQSAGATGAIAGPVGVVAGVAAVGIGLGVAGLIVHFKNKHDESKKESSSADEEQKDKKLPATDNGPVLLTAAFLMNGIQGLTTDDATRLLGRFNTLHVLTVHDFLIVSRTTMDEMFDEGLAQYLDRIIEYQISLLAGASTNAISESGNKTEKAQ